jgi:hypothetical protein
MVRNLDALEAIERRTHRRPALVSGIQLALRRWPTVSVSRRDVSEASRK